MPVPHKSSAQQAAGAGSEEALRDLLLAASSPDNLDAFLRRIIQVLCRPDALGPGSGLVAVIRPGKNDAPFTAALNFTKEEQRRLAAISRSGGKCPGDILSAALQGGAAKGVLLARLAAPASRARAARLLELAARTINGRLAQESREGLLIRERDIADAVTHLEELYLVFPAISLEEISRTVLDEARRLTGSRSGFAGYISPSTGWLTVPAIAGAAPKGAPRPGKELVFKEFTGLWGWVLRKKRPLFTNSAASDRRAGGLPGGHIRIERFAAAPALSGKKLLGILALANPPGDYPPAALDAVKKLARVYALMLHHKLAEAGVQEQAALLKAQQEASPDAILVVDKNGRIRSFNERFTKMWGLPPKIMAAGSDDLALRTVRSNLRDPEAFLKRVKYLYAHPREESRDEVLLKDGRILDRYSTSILSEEGNYYGRIWHFRDITEHRLSETLTRESEGKYRRLVENLGKEYFFYRHDTRGVFNYLSPSITSALGYSQKEFLTHFSKYLTDNPGNKEVLKHTALSIQGIQQPAYEVELYHKDGSVHWLEVTETPLRDQAGKVTGVEGLAHDITARKRATDLLAASEWKYRTLIESSFDIIYLIGKDDTVQYANPAALKHLRRQASEVIGRQRSSFFPPQVSAHQKQALDQVFADGKPLFREQEIKLGNVVNYQETNLIPIKGPDGKVESVLGISRDITERKRLGNILAESEEKFRTLFETSRDALMIVEPPDWKFTQANKATLKMFGAPEEEVFLKLTPWAISPKKQPDGGVSAEKAKEMLEIALKTGSHYFEWEHKCLYGPLFSAEVLLTRVSIGDKQVIQACIRDISARKRMEELLRQSELRQQLAMSQINGVLWVLDKTLRFTLSRGQGLSSLGLKPDEVVGMKLEEFMQPAGPGSPSIAAHLRALQGKNVSYEETVSGIEFSVFLSPLRDQDGKINGVVGIALDISEQKRMERLLKEHEETLAKIFDTTTDVMFIKDANGVFVMANKAFADLLNRPPKEILGKADKDLFPPELAAEAAREDQEVMRTGKTLNFTRGRILPTGNYYFNTVKTPMRNLRGELTGVLGIARDITALKKMESELALARAAETVSKVTRPMAHDINNALAAINGYATLIDDDLASSSPIKNEISRIIEAVKRAALLTSKLQDFARNPKIENPGEAGEKKENG